MDDLMEDRVDSPLNLNQITACNCNKILFTMSNILILNLLHMHDFIKLDMPRHTFLSKDGENSTNGAAKRLC